MGIMGKKKEYKSAKKIVLEYEAKKKIKSAGSILDIESLIFHPPGFHPKRLRRVSVQYPWSNVSHLTRINGEYYEWTHVLGYFSF